MLCSCAGLNQKCGLRCEQPASALSGLPFIWELNTDSSSMGNCVLPLSVLLIQQKAAALFAAQLL